jgi:uncharacterized protein YjiS (DUF1127 family)
MFRIALEDRPSAMTESLAGERRQAGVVHAIASWAFWIRKELRVRRGISELMALDDHMLRDIGVTRAEIESVARHGRWPKTPRR